MLFPVIFMLGKVVVQICVPGMLVMGLPLHLVLVGIANILIIRVGVAVNHMIVVVVMVVVFVHQVGPLMVLVPGLLLR